MPYLIDKNSKQTSENLLLILEEREKRKSWQLCFLLPTYIKILLLRDDGAFDIDVYWTMKYGKIENVVRKGYIFLRHGFFKKIFILIGMFRECFQFPQSYCITVSDYKFSVWYLYCKINNRFTKPQNSYYFSPFILDESTIQTF